MLFVAKLLLTSYKTRHNSLVDQYKICDLYIYLYCNLIIRLISYCNHFKPLSHPSTQASYRGYFLLPAVLHILHALCQYFTQISPGLVRRCASKSELHEDKFWRFCSTFSDRLHFFVLFCLVFVFSHAWIFHHAEKFCEQANIFPVLRLFPVSDAKHLCFMANALCGLYARPKNGAWALPGNSVLNIANIYAQRGSRQWTAWYKLGICAQDIRGLSHMYIPKAGFMLVLPFDWSVLAPHTQVSHVYHGCWW